MKSNIRFIRKYKLWDSPNYIYFDIIYYSGRVVTVPPERLPKTAQAYISECGEPKELFCKLFNRNELIYKKKN